MGYEKLIGKKVNVEFNGDVINSYKIINIVSTNETIDDIGVLFECSVEWENKKLPGADPLLLFDSQTLDDLLKKNRSVCPFMPTLIYKIKK